MKLVASLVVHNEMGRYLEACVDHLLDFCDEIRAVDDGSDDGSCEWLCAKDGVEVLGGPPATFFQHEGRTRQELLDWTLKGEPTHVLAIDADEFVSDGLALRRMLHASPDQTAWTLEMREVWRADDDFLWVREDSGWRSHPIPMLWKVPARLDSEWMILDRALACGREPQAVRRLHSRRQALPVGVDVLHFGWANPEERQKRYDRYAVADGGRFHASAHLHSILNVDPSLVPAPWPEALSRSRLRR